MSVIFSVEGTIASGSLLVVGKEKIRLFMVRADLFLGQPTQQVGGDAFKRHACEIMEHFALAEGFTKDELVRAALNLPEVDKKRAKP